MISINHCKTLPVAKLDLNNNKKESQDKSSHGPSANWKKKKNPGRTKESSAISQKGTKVAKNIPKTEQVNLRTPPSRNYLESKVPNKRTSESFWWRKKERLRSCKADSRGHQTRTVSSLLPPAFLVSSLFTRLFCSDMKCGFRNLYICSLFLAAAFYCSIVKCHP